MVLNYDDPVLREFGQNPELKPRVIWFSSRETLKDGFCMDGDNIVYCQNGRQTVVVNVHDMQLLGRHNYENAMAAIAIGDAMGVPKDAIVRGLRTFQAVEHRIEYVCEKRGVRFYNDSKGTNPTRPSRHPGHDTAHLAHRRRLFRDPLHPRPQLLAQLGFGCIRLWGEHSLKCSPFLFSEPL